jgi:hypothetical protein
MHVYQISMWNKLEQGLPFTSSQILYHGCPLIEVLEDDIMHMRVSHVFVSTFTIEYTRIKIVPFISSPILYPAYHDGSQIEVFKSGFGISCNDQDCI